MVSGVAGGAGIVDGAGRGLNRDCGRDWNVGGTADVGVAEVMGWVGVLWLGWGRGHDSDLGLNKGSLGGTGIVDRTGSIFEFPKNTSSVFLWSGGKICIHCVISLLRTKLHHATENVLHPHLIPALGHLY